MAGNQLEIKKDLKKLVSHITKFEEKEENFQICFDFALSNVLYHKYLDTNSIEVNRIIDGLCLKFNVHCQETKAKALKQLSEKLLFQPVHQSKKDVLWGMMQLLLNLSESPINVKYEVEEQSPKLEDEPIDDWGSHLLDGEELVEVYDDDSSSSSEYEKEPSNDSVCKRSDSGFLSPVTVNVHLLQEEVTEEDLTSGRRWLSENIIAPYWSQTKVSSEIKNNRLVANLAKEWEKYLENNGVILNRGATCVLSEALIIHEAIWLLLGIPDLFVFSLNNDQFVVKEDLQVSHLTEGCLYQFLQNLTIYGNLSYKLRKFIQEMTTFKTDCKITVSEDEEGIHHHRFRVPCQTYQAFAAKLHSFFKHFDSVLIEIEQVIKKSQVTFTLSMLIDKLTPSFDELILLNSVYEQGIASCVAVENWHRAAQLLNALYDLLIELDTMSISNKDLMGFLIPFWLETCRPYMEMIDHWLTVGHLQDPFQEFIIQRNSYVQLKDERYWASAFTIHSLSTIKSPDETSTSVESECDVIGMMKFLQPVLNHIVQAGKSMEIMQNLGRLEDFRDQTNESNCLYDNFVQKFIKLLGEEKMPSEEECHQDNNQEEKAEVQCITENFIQQISIKGIQNAFLDANFSAIFNPSKDQSFNLNDKSLPDKVIVSHLIPIQVAMKDALYPLIEQKCLRICSKLMDILKKDFKVVESLASMRKFYLMEAGDMMFQFYSEVFEKLRAGEVWQESSFLNTVLSEAIAQHYPEELDRLSASVDSGNKRKNICDIKVLESLSLHYKIPWPVDLILNSESQLIYNQVFHFLLQIKRAKYSVDELRFADLEKINMTDSSSDNFDSKSITLSPSRNENIHRMQLFRMRLLHFINSLHNYLMTRILHSTCLTFEIELEKAQDLEQLLSLHSAYLQQIHERCLLHSKVEFIRNTITTILNLALTFQTNWDSGADNISLKFLQDIEIEFQHCYQFLTTFLKNVVKRGAFPHLESLGISLMPAEGMKPLFS